MSLTIPDFTQPQPTGERAAWKKIHVQGLDLYVPQGIRWVNGHWRVTVKHRHTDIKAELGRPLMHSLQDAYLLLMARLKSEQGVERLPGTGRVKLLDTGVIGVRLEIVDLRYLSVVVQQKIAGKPSRVAVSTLKIDGLNQEAIDHALIIATGVRRHYLLVSEQRDLFQALLPHQTPHHLRPSTPVRRVTVAEVLHERDRLQQAQDSRLFRQLAHSI